MVIECRFPDIDSRRGRLPPRLGLRLVGLQYGLPAVYNPDEVSITARALSFARGSLNPHNFLYPTFYFYVLFAWIGVYLAFVWLSGRVSSLQALQQLYFTDPSGIYTAGRRWVSPPARQRLPRSTGWARV